MMLTTEQKKAIVESRLAADGCVLCPMNPDEVRYFIADDATGAATVQADFTIDQLYAMEIKGTKTLCEHIYFGSIGPAAFLSVERDALGNITIKAEECERKALVDVAVESPLELIEIGKTLIEAGLRMQRREEYKGEVL